MRFFIVLVPMLVIGVIAQGAPNSNLRRAKSNYMLNCQGCHLADGSGIPGRVPSMRGLVGSFLTVPGGRDFLVQVPGSANSSLTDAELAEVLNWILASMSDKQLAPDFRYFTEAEVRRLRPHTLLDVAKVRSDLLKKIRHIPK